MSKASFSNDGQFECFGQKYIFRVNLYSNNLKRTAMSLQLDAGNVVQLDVHNAVNQLCMTASLVYTDINGGVDKFLHKEFTYCKVVFFQINPKTDYEPFREQSMYHVFHVNSIEIVNRQKHHITYRLNMISANWWKCVANLDFSNYDNPPEPVLSIVKKLLSQCKLTIDSDSFDKVKSTVKLNYIANGNDNMFTTIPYLLARQYYYQDKHETSMKFLCYDHVYDKFYMFDLDNIQTLRSTEQLLISMFESQNETTLNSYQSNFSTNTYFPFTQVFRSLKDLNATGYNYQKNKFVDMPVKEEDLLQYYNKHFKIDDTFEKYEKRFNAQRDFITRSTYWNNEPIEKLYQNAIDTLLGYNGFIVNVAGNLTRKPGTCMMINVDRGSTTQNEDIDSVKKRFKSIEGHWIVLKVDTFIKPNADSNSRFTQNLTMTRNFVLDDVQKSKKL